MNNCFFEFANTDREIPRVFKKAKIKFLNLRQFDKLVPTLKIEEFRNLYIIFKQILYYFTQFEKLYFWIQFAKFPGGLFCQDPQIFSQNCIYTKIFAEKASTNLKYGAESPQFAFL